MKISIIGVGRLGGALALALAKKGYTIDNLVGRDRPATEKIAEFIFPKPLIQNSLDPANLDNSDAIFICTQDTEIEKVAESLAGKLTGRPVVFHVSGSLSSEILRTLKNDGCAVGSLHPLVSVSDSWLGAERFRDVYFCIEGDAEAVGTAEKIVLDLEGKSFSVETRYKPLYHAAAVTASGHLTALVSVAVEMLAACGMSETAAREILLPLVKSSVVNLETQTPVEALTGTFARADAETMNRHLEIMRASVPRELLDVYLQLGLRSAHLAERRGADAEKIALMKNILSAERMNGENDKQ
jgi:predicted short-subunit dehydrogenase-like oxidoreductase (DUF2520 family)